jgi:hypothetical protein
MATTRMNIVKNIISSIKQINTKTAPNLEFIDEIVSSIKTKKLTQTKPGSMYENIPTTLYYRKYSGDNSNFAYYYDVTNDIYAKEADSYTKSVIKDIGIKTMPIYVDDGYRYPRLIRFYVEVKEDSNIETPLKIIPIMECVDDLT